MNNKMSSIVLPLWKSIEQQKEKWVQWHPRPLLARSYYVASLLQRVHYFEIELIDSENPNRTLFMRFDPGVDGYERNDIRLVQKLLHELDTQYGPSFRQHWSFFTVENSRYLAWVSEQSTSIIDATQPKHFVIIAQNCVVDIIDPFEPTFWSSYEE